MTSVMVCIKRVPEISGEVVLAPDEQSVDGRHTGFTMSVHEECAVELAVQITGATGGEATVVSIGDADATEQLRGALAVGCTDAILVHAEPTELGPRDVARELATVVRDLSAAGKEQQLVLLGNDAADSGDFQVGIRLAYELGWPVVNGVGTVRVEDDHVVAGGEGPDGYETYRVPLPAVVTVLEGGVEPRYPSVPGRMKARKIPIDERELTAPAQGSGRTRIVLPPPEPSSVQVLGEGAAAAPAVVDLLEKLGVVR